MQNKKGLYFIGISFTVVVAAFIFFKSYFETNYSPTPQSSNSPSAQFQIVPFDTATLIKPHSPILGPQDAPVTVVEFLDPECEACRAMYPITKKIMDEFPGKIRLVIRYMPYHGNSIFAAHVLEAAREQGKYWETLELMFLKQAEWASHHDPQPEKLFEIIKELSLDVNKVKAVVESGKYNEMVQIDKLDGEKVGVEGTPTFYVNGQKVMRTGYEPLRAAIAEKIGN